MKMLAEDARELAWCEPGYETRCLVTYPLGEPAHADFTVVENRDYDEKRWQMVMELVVRDDSGELWRAFYRRGLTERQEQKPWEYETEIEFKPVKRKVIEGYEYEDAK